DGRGEYTAAAEHVQQGNALCQELWRKQGQSYDPRAHTAFIDRLMRTCTSEWFERTRGFGLDSERPVFIVGLPRSGTTLTEQILASHPLVHGAGEQLYWSFASDVEAAAPPAERAATIAGLGREYLATLGKLSAGAARVVDKLPSNFRNLGLIHAALP